MSTLSCPVEGEKHTPGSLRRGYCRRHYERLRRYGSPEFAHVASCEQCGMEFVASSGGKRICSDACKKARAAAWAKRYYAQGGMRAISCSVCGAGMSKGATSAPEGEATCMDCRRKVHGYRGYKRGCRCMECRAGVSAREAERRRGGAAPTPGARNGRGTWIDPAKRHAIYARDGWVCGLCGLPTLRRHEPGDHRSPSLDHIVPRSMGGGNDEGNLRTAHSLCNAIRGDGHLDISVDEYRLRLEVAS